jgi:hypothetical protein
MKGFEQKKGIVIRQYPLLFIGQGNSSVVLFNFNKLNEHHHLLIFPSAGYPTVGTGNTKDVTQIYGTLAHEFQHMVNFNENVLIAGSSKIKYCLFITKF